MKTPEVPEHLYGEALSKFADMKAPFQQWIAACAIILLKQYPDQPEGIAIDAMGCKLRISLEKK